MLNILVVFLLIGTSILLAMVITFLAMVFTGILSPIIDPDFSFEPLLSIFFAIICYFNDIFVIGIILNILLLICNIIRTVIYKKDNDDGYIISGISAAITILNFVLVLLF